MRRNCSLAPRQLLFALGIAAMLPVVFATFLFGLGATLVMPFAWLEVAALAVALLAYARHAGDRELVRIGGGRLEVERIDGARVERADFDAARVRVEADRGRDRLIELAGEGRRIAVGRFVRPELRAALARELRFALLRQREAV